MIVIRVCTGFTLRSFTLKSTSLSNSQGGCHCILYPELCNQTTVLVTSCCVLHGPPLITVFSCLGAGVQTAWDRQPVPDNLPPPSQRHRQQYAQLQHEAAESYRRKAAPVTQVKMMLGWCICVICYGP